MVSSKSAIDNVKSQAYLVYSEWGPSLRIPRDERLAGCFPELAADQREGWLAEFKAIDGELWRIAEAALPRTGSYQAFTKRLTGIFPFMNEEAVGRAWALATYYTVHEGY